MSSTSKISFTEQAQPEQRSRCSE